MKFILGVFVFLFSWLVLIGAWLGITSILALLLGCAAYSDTTREAQAHAFDGCACITEKCESSSSFSGKAAVAAAQENALRQIEIKGDLK